MSAIADIGIYETCHKACDLCKRPHSCDRSAPGHIGIHICERCWPVTVQGRQMVWDAFEEYLDAQREAEQ